MWMVTTMNYQYSNGGTFLGTIRKLYAEGGVMRFYRGIVPALIVGPIARFGDTAANMFAKNIFKSPKLAKFPIFIQTSLGSFLAGLWRLVILPIDTWKISKQVHGEKGFQMLMEKYRIYKIKAFYQGGIASASATMVGHYPWFLTNNYMEYYIPKSTFKEEKFKATLRGAFIGFCSTVVSDSCSNSIRIMKTVKQASGVQLTYKQAYQQVVKKDGISGLFFRGLKTRLMTSCLRGIIFSVVWKYFQQQFGVDTKKQ